jgi:hypothetical protein
MELIMDSEHVKGAADNVKGAVKDTAGKKRAGVRSRRGRHRKLSPLDAGGNDPR